MGEDEGEKAVQEYGSFDPPVVLSKFTATERGVYVDLFVAPRMMEPDRARKMARLLIQLAEYAESRGAAHV